MNKIVGLLAAICFVVALIVHGLTVAQVDVLESFAGVWLLHIGIFFFLIPYAISTKRIFGFTPSIDQLRSVVPKWAGVLLMVAIIYVIFNFVLFVFHMDGQAEIRNGHFILESKGKFIRELTEQEYHLQRAYLVRGFSGHWLLFYLAPAFYFLFGDDSKAQAYLAKQQRALTLPPGQYESETFPRFGLSAFAERFPKDSARVELSIGGDVDHAIVVSDELKRIARVEQQADFHCVTTWTHRSLHWSGIRFSDFYREIAMPLANPSVDAVFVVLRSQDGYHASLPLQDLLARDVLLADTLNGQPLSIAHGAPLRLIAPAHYGYKNIKHVNRIEFWRSSDHYRPVGLRFMAHPRARVAQEERGRWIPGWMLRYLYRPLVRPTVARFERAMRKHSATVGDK